MIDHQSIPRGRARGLIALLFMALLLMTGSALANNTLSGYVSDAVTGDPIPGATVYFGEQETTSNAEGFYEFTDVPEGGLSADFYANNTEGEAPLSVDFFDASSDATEGLSAEAQGYTYFRYDHVRIVPGANSFDFSMSPEIFDEEIRIVLNWGETPRDLDSHLLTPEIEGQSYHIYYPLGSRGSEDSPPFANLDVDDTTSFGPETITIYERFSGTYHYFVHNYTGRNTPLDTGLANSGAFIQVSDATGTTNVLTVPNGEGRYWYVGTINGSTGVFTAINRIQDTMPGSSGANQLIGPLPEKPVSAIDEAASTIVAWAWDFGDGITSDERNPSHTYQEAGEYTVTLEVTNQTGDTDSITKTDFVIVIGSESVTSLSGYVTDAFSGEPLADIPVTLGRETVYSDEEGYYRFEPVPLGGLSADFDANNRVGPAPLEVEFFDYSSTSSLTISAEALGYLPYRNAQVSIEPGVENEQNIPLSPEIAADNYRFVLSWGEHPRDLDSHLLTPQIEGQPHHIAYYNRGSEEAPPFANLDLDDTTSYGPETVTIYDMFSGRYTYFVHLYAGEGTLNTSEAEVEIYTETGLAHSLRAPSTGEGRYWYVGDLDGETGRFTIVNRIQDMEPGMDNAASGFASNMVYPPKAVANVFDTAFITAWFWDFGDNNSSDEQNPIHLYTQPGRYDVTLRIYDDQGQFDEIVKEDFILVEGSSGESAALSVTVSGPGLVTSTPDGILCGVHCDAQFEVGQTVTLRAQPNVRSTFVGWDGACEGSQSYCMVTIEDDTEVTAHFQNLESTDVSLAVNVIGEGEVTSEPQGVDCSGLCLSRFPAGTEVTLTATPAEGWIFTGWQGGECSGSDRETCTLGLARAMTVVAEFEEEIAAGDYVLEVVPVGLGSITSAPEGIDCGGSSASDCEQAYSEGTEVTLTAAPDSGNEFVGWGGACASSGTDLSCTLTMDQAQLAVAAFGQAPPRGESTAWKVAEIYMATMGYSPDNEGLQYWVRNIDTIPQWTPETVAQSFFDQPLVQEVYPETSSNREFIDELYRNVYGRGADAGGMDYWLQQLDSGQIARNQMIIALINGGWDNESPDAQSDMLRFGYRIEVALAFAEFQADNNIVYGLLSEEDQLYLREVGRDILLGVTTDESTRDAAINSIPALLAPLVQQ